MMIMKIIGLVTLSTLAKSFSIMDSEAEPPLPREGGKVLLKCRSNGWFEYCTWRHKDRVCEFEWKRSHRAVKKQTCTALNNRAHFVGTYESHECYIEISNLTMGDAGEWSCEMEKYVAGIFPGSTDKAFIQLEIKQKALPTEAPPEVIERIEDTSEDSDAPTTRSTSSTTSPVITESSPNIVFPDQKNSTTPSSSSSSPSSNSSDRSAASEDPSVESGTEDDIINLNDTTVNDGSRNDTVVKTAAQVLKENLVPVSITVSAGLIVFAIATVMVLFRHRQKYKVTAKWGDSDNDLPSSGDDGGVKFTKETGKLEMAPFASDLGEDLNKEGVDNMGSESYEKQNLSVVLDVSNTLC